MDISKFEYDIFPTALGELTIYFIGHGTLILRLGDKIIHVDPFTRLADYAGAPPADIIFITHEHRDHLDPDALQHIRTGRTIIILTEIGAGQMDGGLIMKNGDSLEVEGIRVEAVPAYNLKNLRENGQPFHPKGHGNGYVLTFGDLRLYIAGDTEDIPEMKDLKNIDIAFLPMNLPYTMTPKMASDAAGMFMPKLLYPYHYGSTDPSELISLLADKPIEVRIRSMA